MPGRSVALALLIAAAPSPAQAVAPAPARHALEAVATDLARNGWSTEAPAVADPLQGLGHEPAALTALRASLAKLQSKAPKPVAGERLVPGIRKAAAGLATLLPTAGEQKAPIARAVLALDDQVADAQLALGR